MDGEKSASPESPCEVLENELSNKVDCEHPEQEVIENISSTPTSKNSKKESGQKLLIDINFRNKKTYFAFHEEFIDLIKKYYKEKLDDLDVCDDASSNRICISEKLVKKSDSFLIDTTPNVDFNKNSAESTPRYNSFTKTVLSNIQTCKEEKKSVSSLNKCFNCDKNHSLRDCPEPRNFNKIRKARNEFNRKELRYHDDETDEYSNLIPGKLSDDLKSALGLTDNQIPLHVYKMRMYGYPPAWLEEAKVSCSGLQVLDDKVEFDNGEDNIKYDIQKIFEFPGFNVSPAIPFIDKHRLLNLPPMLPEHSKEEFVSSLGDYVINGYKRRKIRSSNSAPDLSANIETTEMDIDNDFPSQNISDTANNLDSSEEGELSSNSNHSSNVDELQNERDKLLSQLSEINDEYHQTGSSTEINQQQSEISIENHQENGIVETTIYGCPLLPSFSPFENLPIGEKFQAGVCDVIAFENLAESTGKYEKMKGLIKKVRVFQKEHMKE